MRPPGPGPGQPSVPAGFSLVQVQGDRLLGDRGAQPPDLLPRRRQDLDEGLRVTEFTLRSDTVISLQTGVTRRLVAGYFLPLLSHEVRRKARTANPVWSQIRSAGWLRKTEL